MNRLEWNSFGKTWLSYDAEGRVLLELRRRTGLTGCGAQPSTNDKNPSTTYAYDLNGNLVGIVYPHGRAVQYVYALDRPVAINHSTWNGSAWNATYAPSTNTWTTGTPTTVIDSIAWEPYGGLRGYKLSTAGASGAGLWVEYYLGGSLETESSAVACDLLNTTYAGYDNSGRLRGVFVSDSSASLGRPNGSVFKQVYTWNRDQLTAQQTCHRNSGTVIRDSFGYDRTQRLTATGTNATDAGVSSEAFSYDLRGNRSSLTATSPACVVQNDVGATWQLDLLTSRKWGTTYGTSCNAAVGKYDFSYDKDGRRTAMTDVSGLYSVTTGYAQSSAFAGYDTVFQAAVVGGGSYYGGTYSYFYDALNRRRAKTTPWGSTDEYFYDLGHQLLSDRGTDNIGGSPVEYPEDDYIWVGGRPVVIIRNRFTPTWGRYQEQYEVCRRNGQDSVCSTHYPVADYLGKPVVVLNSINGTAGIGRYEGFGMVNRREARYATTHNVNSATATVMTINEDMPPDFDGVARVLINKSAYTGKLGTTTFNGTVQPLSPFAVDTTRAHVWTTGEYRGSTGWPLTWASTSTSSYGLDIEAYDFKIKQAWHWWFWIPLGQPGQYYDEETELYENWNRYYDPLTGQYLQPDPLLQDPKYVATMARKEMSTPTYSYANNNPALFTDPTGLYSWRRDCPDKGVFERGFAIETSPLGGLTSPHRLRPTPGSVAFHNFAEDTCTDCREARAMKSNSFEFSFAADCWAELVKEICDACEQSKNQCK